MAKDTGRLILKFEYDKLYIKRIHLWIPSLNIQKENVADKIQLDRIPRGHHRATLTLYSSTGKPVKHELVLNVLADKDNFQTVNLYDLPQEVTIRPVNTKEKTVIATEVKIEGIDSSFRPVRDEAGVTYALRPGTYEVKIVTPEMEIKTFSIEIKEDVHVYALPIEEMEEARTDPRVTINVPAAYRTEDGNWHSTRSINISSRGVCLLREPQGAKDNRLFLRLLIPISENMVECYANVKWSKESKVDTSLMGLELEVDDNTRTSIRRWLDLQENMKSVSHNFIRR